MESNIPTLNLIPVETRYYPCYLDDTTVEVIIAKARNGYFMNYYAISYQEPFFCFADHEKEELDMMIEDALIFHHDYRALERTERG